MQQTLFFNSYLLTKLLNKSFEFDDLLNRVSGNFLTIVILAGFARLSSLSLWALRLFGHFMRHDCHQTLNKVSLSFNRRFSFSATFLD